MSYHPYLLFFAIGLLPTAVQAQSPVRPQLEEDYYEIKTIAIPTDVRLEVGGVAPMPDGRVGVCTRRGEVWIIENPNQVDGTPAHFTLFASGLHEALGLAYRDGAFYCCQRGELTKLTDTDADGQADLYESVASWDLSGNYHEYSYGPVFDKNGDIYLTFNVAWVGYGEGKLAKWRGWLVKVTKDGGLEPIATGLRSPAGFNINANGDIFYGENQGDWVGSGRITHLEKGDFAGHAGGLFWTKEPESPLRLLTKAELPDNGEPMYEAAKKIKELKLPAVWFPHALMGISTADMVEDDTEGKFGPFQGQYFVLDQGQSTVMRMTLEKINGRYQGACYPFRAGFQSGALRGRWGSDGSLLVGMTSRGWGSTGADAYGLQRLVWNGQIPFEMKNVRATPDGFEIEFTQPVSRKSAEDFASYALQSFTYEYHHQYGSPIINMEETPLRAAIVSEDRLKVRLVLGNLRKGYIHQVQAAGLTNDAGQALLHDVSYYTLNDIPAGEMVNVPAPTSKPVAAKTPKSSQKAKSKPETTAKAAVNPVQVAALLKKHACVGCHAEAKRMIGPSYVDIAKRSYSDNRILELVYHPQPANWPEYATEMAPMSHVPKEDVLKIAAWINGLDDKPKTDPKKIDNRD